MDAQMLPGQSVICPVTVAELQAGGLIAADLAVRARRLATAESTADIEVRSSDGEAAAEWAWLRGHLAETGRRINVNDLGIAATAATHGLPKERQADDFAQREGLEVSM